MHDQSSTSRLSKILNYKNILLVIATTVLIVSLSGALYLKLKPKSISSTQIALNAIANKPLLVPLKNFPTSAQNGPFTCPLKSSFCKDKNIFKSDQISVQLSRGSSILAAFDGEILIFKYTHPLPSGQKEDFVNVLLQNREKGLIAKYFFKGDVDSIHGNTVHAGDQIGISNGDPISFMKNTSFTFSLSKVTATAYEDITLSPEVFK